MFVSRHNADDMQRTRSFTANKISVVELSWNDGNSNYFIAEKSKPLFLSTLLVLGWFFKPKVVFDSPETKLQCMGPELNKNMLNGLAKESIWLEDFLNSCVRAVKKGRVWSNTKPSLLWAWVKIPNIALALWLIEGDSDPSWVNRDSHLCMHCPNPLADSATRYLFHLVVLNRSVYFVIPAIKMISYFMTWRV